MMAGRRRRFEESEDDNGIDYDDNTAAVKKQTAAKDTLPISVDSGDDVTPGGSPSQANKKRRLVNGATAAAGTGSANVGNGTQVGESSTSGTRVSGAGASTAGAAHTAANGRGQTWKTLPPTPVLNPSTKARYGDRKVKPIDVADTDEPKATDFADLVNPYRYHPPAPARMANATPRLKATDGFPIAVHRKAPANGLKSQHEKLKATNERAYWSPWTDDLSALDAISPVKPIALKTAEADSVAANVAKLKEALPNADVQVLRSVLESADFDVDRALAMATGGDDDPIASRASSAEPKRRRLVRKKDTSSKEATPDVQVVSVKPAPPKPARFQEDSGDETDVDDGPTTSYGETALDRKTVDFFNTATPQQMTEAMTVCTAAQADFIVGLRPFRSMGHLEESLTGHKGNRPLAKLPEKYQEIQEGYNEVDALIEKCERYGDEVMSILREWTHAPPDAPVGEKVDEDGDAPEISLTHIDATADSDSDSDVTTRPQQSSLASTNPPKPARWKCLKSQPALINPALTLKSYQLVGVSWLYMLHGKGLGGILADEMGLGKTAQVISFLALLKQHGHQTRHLIVVPTSTLENWLREFARWCPNLVVRPYHGSQNERYGLQEQYMDEVDGIDVFVTTYTLATGQKPDRAFLRRLNCTSLILDEGHMVKNMESARYKHLMSFKTPFRLLLTGTPLQNNLMELLALLTFIMPRLFANVDAFGKIFNVKNSGENGFLSRQRIERAKKIMAPFVLRRKKRQVLKELPAKTVKIELCTPTETQKMLYEGIIAESRKSLLAQAEEAAAAAAAEKQAESSPAPPTKPKGKTKPAKSKKGAAAGALQRQTPAFGQRQLSNVLMQLRKAADHPLLFRTLYTNTHLRTLAREIMREDEYIDASREYIYEDMTVMSDFELHNLCGRFKGMKKHCLAEESWMDAGKVEWLKRNLLVMRDRGDRILVFSQFVMMLDVLEAVLGTMGVRYVRMDGRTNIVERQTRIDEFNENPDITVFLLSTKAGGFGINLTSANVVIIYDMDFNPHNDAQAEDRAHRVGQTRDVTVYKLVLDNSIEQHILKNAQTKLKLDERVQEGEQQHQQPHVVFDGEGGKGKGKETDSDTAEGAEGGKEDEAAEIADVGFLEMLRNELVAGS